MKKLILSIILFVAFIANSVSQNGVIIEYKITSTKGTTGTMKLYHSTIGSRMEMQMNSPQIPNGGFSKINIVKSDKPTTVYMLDEKSKTYTITETKSLTNLDSTSEYTVKIIGKEKVNNYNCTHATVTRGTKVTEYWTTTEIADYEKYNKTNENNKFIGPGNEYKSLVKNGAGGFIVKTITKGSQGADFTMELVKFEKKELAAGMFEIPADYKVSTLPSMPGGVDMNKLKNMTPEEREKYIEEMKKQYGTPPAKGGN